MMNKQQMGISDLDENRGTMDPVIAAKSIVVPHVKSTMQWMEHDYMCKVVEVLQESEYPDDGKEKGHPHHI